MGEMLRLIILALASWLMWHWITGRHRITRRVDPDDSHAKPSGRQDAFATPYNEPPTQMVKCAKCKLYLPADDAFHFQKRYFCGLQHLHSYLDGSGL